MSKEIARDNPWACRAVRSAVIAAELSSLTGSSISSGSLLNSSLTLISVASVGGATLYTSSPIVISVARWSIASAVFVSVVAIVGWLVC